MITPSIVSESNLSIAWAKTFLALMNPNSNIRHPSIVIVNNLAQGDSPEHNGIRSALDSELRRHGESSCLTVANTIFPRSMWNPNTQDDAKQLFKRYEGAWPGIRKCPANRNGVYFRRLTAFQTKEQQGPSKVQHGPPINQLQFIIDTYRDKGNHRKSALQASILDPTRDHTDNRVKGFPCMQQVSFTPLDDNALSVTGYYATQYQFEKAYGNYLGLYWLGRFMAKQLGLQLSQVVCVASVLNRGEPPKHKLEAFASQLKTMIDSSAEN
jgi:hypothetical protein